MTKSIDTQSIDQSETPAARIDTLGLESQAAHAAAISAEKTLLPRLASGPGFGSLVLVHLADGSLAAITTWASAAHSEVGAKLISAWQAELGLKGKIGHALGKLLLDIRAGHTNDGRMAHVMLHHQPPGVGRTRRKEKKRWKRTVKDKNGTTVATVTITTTTEYDSNGLSLTTSPPPDINPAGANINPVPGGTTVEETNTSYTDENGTATDPSVSTTATTNFDNNGQATTAQATTVSTTGGQDTTIVSNSTIDPVTGGETVTTTTTPPGGTPGQPVTENYPAK